MPEIINIALADDSPLILDGLSFVLSSQPDMVITGKAINGKELIDVVTNTRPHIVITDIQMPVMTGIEATKLIKQKFPSIAVIGLTGFGQDSSIEKMLDAGASGYMLKDASRDDIITAIQTVHSGNKYFCSSTSTKLAEMLAAKNDGHKRPHKGLTEREQQIVILTAQQLNSKQIASHLNLSIKTVDAHKLKIMEKLNVIGTVGIAIYGIREGLITR